jgi:hypothetical protein
MLAVGLTTSIRHSQAPACDSASAHWTHVAGGCIRRLDRSREHPGTHFWMMFCYNTCTPADCSGDRDLLTTACYVDYGVLSMQAFSLLRSKPYCWTSYNHGSQRNQR